MGWASPPGVRTRGGEELRRFGRGLLIPPLNRSGDHLQ